MRRGLDVLPIPDFRNILNWKWTFGLGPPIHMSLHYLTALCGKEDWLQHLCSMGEHDGSYLHFHKYTSYQCLFLIIEARVRSFLLILALCLIWQCTNYQTANYSFKINLSDTAQLPHTNICFSRGDRMESQVTVRCMWHGFVSLEGSSLPLAAIWQLQQLFAAQQYYVACRKGMWWYCSPDLQLV